MVAGGSDVAATTVVPYGVISMTSSYALDPAIAEVRTEFELDDAFVPATKLGERLYVEMDFAMPVDSWDAPGEDHVRPSLIGRIEPLGYELWANVELTTDPPPAR